MKMVKSLLLGSAAGMVAVMGAQAADLPVKAKPVEYVKVCSLYGEGFFYIPGTDTCLKIGGWVRAEWSFNQGLSAAPYTSNANNRTSTNDIQTRARYVVSFDTRTQTEYGTLRSYIRAGAQTSSQFTNEGGLYVERIFIQFAGFTFGKTQSFFDFMGGAVSYTGYTGGYSNTGATGTLLAAYTFQFGNGFTSTIAVEDNTQRRGNLWDSNDAANLLTIGALPGPIFFGATGYEGRNGGTNQQGDYAATSAPDIVANLRVDQAWGAAQVSGAVHQLRANAYGTNTALPTAGYPGDKWGWAVNGGLMLNLPWAAGDKVYVEATYAEGAACYVGMCVNGTQAVYGRFRTYNGQGSATAATAPGTADTVAASWVLDSVFGGSGTQQELTKTFALTGGIEHYWTPALRTSVWGTYTNIDYTTTAASYICNANGPIRLTAGGGSAVGAPGCNPDFRVWAVGTRTIWNPVKNLDLGFEVYYVKIDTDWGSDVVASFAGSGGRPAGFYNLGDAGIWQGLFRVQRNFWP